MFAWADLFTILVLIVLEGLLSADNAIVLAMMVLGLPKHQQKKALRYGIIGAFVFRVIAILAAVFLIELEIVKLIGAAYLLYLPYKHFSEPQDKGVLREPPKARPMFGLTAFWATVVKVELTDIIFSIDSVLAAVAMSSKQWVIIAGGLAGIVTMRMVAGQVMTLIERFPALVDGAFIAIAWVGTKLLVEFLHGEGFISFAIPQWLSLGTIVLIFLLSFIYAKRHPSSQRPHVRPEDLTIE